MKKQCKKIPSWGCKGLLSVALISLAVVAHAQGADICAGSPYTIASAVDASGATTYRWLENGKIISGAKAATYLVPSSNAVGNYTYIRQAKSEDCDEWQSSNEFTVTVYNCSFSAGTATGATATFIDPRDGKRYKTVVMPDGKTWFAQNLNYTKDLTFNASVFEANGKPYAPPGDALAIGSYWCSGFGSSAEKNTCDVYGALYSLPTAWMIDGKYNDAAKTSSVWENVWLYPSWRGTLGAIGTSAGAATNHARGGGQGICPKGWHIPTLLEWAQLLDAVDESNAFTNLDNSYSAVQSVTFDAVRDTLVRPDTVLLLDGSWQEYLGPGSNLYGFSLRPAGGVELMDSRGANYASVGWKTFMWSSSAWSEPYGVGFGFFGGFIRPEPSLLGSAFPLRCCLD